MKTILFFGDSNTYGYDPRGIWEDRYPARNRWVEQLKREADGTGWEIRADGLNGRRIPVSEAENEYAAQLLCALPPESLFAPMLGTNDLLEYALPNVDRVAKRMENWIRRLQPLRPDVRWLLLSPPRMGSERSADLVMVRFHKAGKMLADRYRELADRYGMDFIDTTEWEIPLAFDEVHFSDEGHLTFAEHMAEKLGEMYAP